MKDKIKKIEHATVVIIQDIFGQMGNDRRFISRYDARPKFDHIEEKRKKEKK